MNNDEIIRMAREAGCSTSYGLTYPPILKAVVFTPEQLKRFVDLISASERESCAVICEEESLFFARCSEGAYDGRYDWKADSAMDCAVAIREKEQHHDNK